ncbi:type I restriction endonuclease [Massilia rubra]|uniref:Restriction endonuclease type I HsdR N-terminal domain-containing protein n=1 Tax=Massilia rubra TaxID=2607910 RepID=A0ABX0LTF0_9BURK|nr:hypothetical protein [Massilia rubra]
MGIEQEIEGIRAGIKAGRFPNEASVSQGIVLRLLNGLGWPTYDTESVWPEYSLGTRRVDFALCSPPGKPIAFIEVKQIGQSDGAERQLFEYAFHIGVPLAILTDGREWNFFLPGGQGDYGERRVYKLDIVERDLAECAQRLKRYLCHVNIASGAAIEAAQDDYRNVSRERQMLAALPKAWGQIIADEDEMLLEIVADRVESLCGFKPDPDMVAKFLKEGVVTRVASAVYDNGIDRHRKLLPVAPATAVRTPLLAPNASARSLGFTLFGVLHPARNAIDALRQFFELLIAKDPAFAERFASLPKHGRSRRYLAKDVADLYPGRPDLARECSKKVAPGWWLSTNHSKQTIGRIFEMACEVAGMVPGKDLLAHLGD